MKVVEFIKYLNLKSVIFNLKYFGVKESLKLPVLLHKKVKVYGYKGRIELPDKIKFGMIKIGYSGPVFDAKNRTTVWHLQGVAKFYGKAKFGNGSKISIGKDSLVDFGHGFRLGADSELISRKHMKFGNNCGISWCVSIMDSDLHLIKGVEDSIINNNRAVVFENDVWIGCKSVVLKGVRLKSGSIVAAGTIVSKSNDNCKEIITSNTQYVLKSNVERVYNTEESKYQKSWSEN